MSLAVVGSNATDTVYAKLQFFPKACGNKECKAPTEWWVLNGVVIQSICRTCSTMLQPIVEDDYWVALEAEYQQENQERERRLNRLRPGGEYFEG